MNCEADSSVDNFRGKIGGVWLFDSNIWARLVKILADNQNNLPQNPKTRNPHHGKRMSAWNTYYTILRNLAALPGLNYAGIWANKGETIVTSTQVRRGKWSQSRSTSAGRNAVDPIEVDCQASCTQALNGCIWIYGRNCASKAKELRAYTTSLCLSFFNFPKQERAWLPKESIG